MVQECFQFSPKSDERRWGSDDRWKTVPSPRCRAGTVRSDKAWCAPAHLLSFVTTTINGHIIALHSTISCLKRVNRFHCSQSTNHSKRAFIQQLLKKRLLWTDTLKNSCLETRLEMPSTDVMISSTGIITTILTDWWLRPSNYLPSVARPSQSLDQDGTRMSSGQSDFTKGRIDAAHGWFNCIQHLPLAPGCTPT